MNKNNIMKGFLDCVTIISKKEKNIGKEMERELGLLHNIIQGRSFDLFDKKKTYGKKSGMKWKTAIL